MKKLIVLILMLNIAYIAQAQSREKGVVTSIDGLKMNGYLHDFGKIKQKKPATASFILTNTSKKALVIKSAKGSCHCTNVQYDKRPIAPGKSTTIKATYDAKNPGDFQQSIYVTTNLSKEILGLKIKGIVE